MAFDPKSKTLGADIGRAIKQAIKGVLIAVGLWLVWFAIGLTIIGWKG